MLSPIIFSANPDLVDSQRFRLRRQNAANGPRPSQDALGMSMQIEALNKDVLRLENLVEKQSSDIAHLVKIVRNLATHDTAQ